MRTKLDTTLAHDVSELYSRLVELVDERAELINQGVKGEELEKVSWAYNFCYTRLRDTMGDAQYAYIQIQRVVRDLEHLIELGADTLTDSEQLELMKFMQKVLKVRRELKETIKGILPKQAYVNLMNTGEVYYGYYPFDKVTCDSYKAINVEGQTRFYACRSTHDCDILLEWVDTVENFSDKFPHVSLKNTFKDIKEIQKTR